MFIALLALIGLASAQTTTDTTPSTPSTGGFDAHGFRLVSFDADARDPMRFQRPGDMDAGAWYAGGLFEYANRPLVFQGANDAEPVSYLRDVVGANLAAGVVAADPVRFDLSVPLYFASTGLAGSQGASLGDVRLSSLVTFLQPRDAGGLGFGAVAALDVPTGSPEDFLGNTGIAGTLALASTFESDALTVSGQAGVRFAPNTKPEDRPAPTEGGDAVDVAGGVGYLVADGTGVNLEAHVAVPVDAVVRTAIGVPAEATLSVRHVRPQGAHVSGGVGVGLGQGAGASPVRLLIGGGFGTSTAAPADVDGDGLSDRDDACVSQPETVNGFNDEDGCPDALPTLTLGASWTGGAVDDAVIVLSGESKPAPAKVSGAPGTLVEVVAKAGECLRGERSLTFGEVDAAVDVPMERVFGTVELSVTGADGSQIPGAQVRYMVEDDRCMPEDRSIRSGKGSHQVGPGEHTVMVSAQGFGVHRQTITLAQGATVQVNAVLKPTKVQLEEGRITIAEKVFFETGKTVIEARSLPLLDEVASVILAHPVGGQVEVQGHTDDQGNDAANLKLSQGRAEAVRDYLVTKGVAAEQLVAKGYGETKPIASNASEDGRGENRRVEFHIIKKN
jgi:outer membrane protein OmpA-like peptidoglycan-associated protein